MSTVAEIEAAIRNLGPGDQVQLMDRLGDLAEDLWDRQIAADAAAGLLDDLLAEAEADIVAGRVKPLHEVIDHR
jgi:hypothetical protein